MGINAIVPGTIMKNMAFMLSLYNSFVCSQNVFEITVMFWQISFAVAKSINIYFSWQRMVPNKDDSHNEISNSLSVHGQIGQIGDIDFGDVHMSTAYLIYFEREDCQHNAQTPCECSQWIEWHHKGELKTKRLISTWLYSGVKWDPE